MIGGHISLMIWVVPSATSDINARRSALAIDTLNRENQLQRAALRRMSELTLVKGDMGYFMILFTSLQLTLHAIKQRGDGVI